MELNEILQKLQESSEFKEWKQKHPDAFLAHAFVMMDETNKNVWQLGYYNKEKNTMTTFVVNDEIKVIPDQEILQSDTEIKPLNASNVKLTVKEALNKAEEVKKEHYPKELTAKTFFIIQHMNNEDVFNITFFTMAFKTINIKLSVLDGKVITHSIQVLAKFG